MPPGGSEQQGDKDGEPEREHGQLGQQPQTGEEPEEQPEARFVPLEDEQQDVGGRHLEELVEGVHREKCPEHEKVGRDEDRERGYALGEPAAPKLPRHEPGENHDSGPGQRRQEAECQQRVAQRGACQGGREGHERREVYVAQVQPLARGDVVELVPEVPVISGGEQVHKQLDEGQQEKDGTAAEERPAGAPFFGDLVTRLRRRAIPTRPHGGILRPNLGGRSAL